MQIIGLTGGIASGKSTVAEYLRKNDITVIDADQLSREALVPGTVGYRKACKMFPTAVDLETGLLDRLKLGEIIFQDYTKRKALERIVHPIVIWGIIKSLAWHWLRGTERVILDVPLLFESRLDRWMSHTVVIATDTSRQLQRLAQRNSFTKQQSLDRINAQMPIEEKCQLADIIIHNDGTFEDLYRQIDEKIIRPIPNAFVHRILLHVIPLLTIATIIVIFLLWLTS
jgi:dephospho-CoA kinase